jgi:hypothetical protein
LFSHIGDMLYFGGACSMAAASLQIIAPRVGEIFALIESPFKGAPTVIAAIVMTLIHRQAVRHGLAGAAEQPT